MFMVGLVPALGAGIYVQENDGATMFPSVEWVIGNSVHRLEKADLVNSYQQRQCGSDPTLSKTQQKVLALRRQHVSFLKKNVSQERKREHLEYRVTQHNL
eukprot:TRINITY_DN72561_c0_g1_i1.p2 TRINITY_DN72561_c0_g1~~TRINITY_DN72561_c0_g1_i1.p2  ORF type:complete len:116 (-),score=8.13 TRINITY_DN72561_c0_g1_i1:99-398(-)